jgi:hypothetical protein
VYTKSYTVALTALGQSFLDDNPMTLDINDGVYYAYSTKPGDTPSSLINPNLFAHPSIEADAEHDAMNNPIDARLLRKTAATDSPGGARITAGLPRRPDNTQLPVLSFKKLYPNPESSVPLIRNEELILLEAEAKWFTNDHAGAMTALNTVRQVSGHLAPISAPADDAGFITALLHEREFSLLFEGGHRWIDARRFGRLDKLPVFVTVDKDTGEMTPDTLNARFPVPLSECNARPTDAACM